jgi:hypothetical protein
MLQHEKNTMLNKVLQLEQWIDGYTDKECLTMPLEDVRKRIKLWQDIERNLNSIKHLIKTS